MNELPKPPSKRAEFVRIVLGVTVLSIVYGILHDLITAHVCVEYFTEYHPHVIDSESPIAMALLWGVIATWWFGAGAGAVIAAVSCLGARRPIPARRALILTGKTMIVAFLLAMLTLVLVLPIAKYVPDALLPPELGGIAYRSRLIAVGAAHNVSYAANFVGAIFVCIRLHLARKKEGVEVPSATL